MASAVAFVLTAIFAGTFSKKETVPSSCLGKCPELIDTYPYKEYTPPLAAIGILSFIAAFASMPIIQKNRFNKIRDVLLHEPKATWTDIQTRTNIAPMELWSDLKELLAKGEIVYETDTNKSYYSLSASKKSDDHT
jgi:hypothetical protein